MRNVRNRKTSVTQYHSYKLKAGTLSAHYARTFTKKKKKKCKLLIKYSTVVAYGIRTRVGDGDFFLRHRN